MVARTVSIPKQTVAAIRDLAAITDVHAEDPVPEIVFDALRVYEWVIIQQAQRRTVAALTERQLQALQSAGLLDDGETLLPFVPDSKREEALNYIRQAQTPRKRRR